MADGIAFILLFVVLSAAEVTTRQRAIERKITRKRALVEVTAKFALVLSLYVGLDIGYRAWAGGSPSIFLIPGVWFVVGFGMLAAYLVMVASMLKKLNQAGVSK